MYFFLNVHCRHLECRCLDPDVQRVLLGGHGSTRYIVAFQSSKANVLGGRVSPMLKGYIESFVGVMIVSGFKNSRSLPRLEHGERVQLGHISCSCVSSD